MLSRYRRLFVRRDRTLMRLVRLNHALDQNFGTDCRCMPHQAVGPIAIVLELSKGPIVYALQKYEFFVLFPLNPSTLAKYREALTPSRAKDDPTDAQLARRLLNQAINENKQVIETHVLSEISPEEFSQLCNMSLSNFKRHFKKICIIPIKFFLLILTNNFYH